MSNQMKEDDATSHQQSGCFDRFTLIVTISIVTYENNAARNVSL